MATSRAALLLLVLLGLSAQLGLARSSSHKRRSKWERAEWCSKHDECPQFRCERSYEDYTIRTYRQARWVVTQEADSSFEIAYLKAHTRLRAYFDGKNSEGERLRHTAPFVSELHRTPDGQATEKNYTFALYLPDRYQGRHGKRVPKPLDPSVRINKWERDRLFVRHFPGFATAATILNQANMLVDTLEEDDRDFDEDTIWVAVYDPAYRLTDRHNEVLMLAPSKKKKGTNCAGAA